MSTDKPHKGTIENWFVWQIPESLDHLGYVIVGDSVDHPQFAGEVIRTSVVVGRIDNEIETRNSRYTLGRAAVVQDEVKA